MNTGKNRVKGLKTELFKKKYQTQPVVQNPSEEIKNLQGQTLTGMVRTATQDFEEKFKYDQMMRQNNPLRLPTNRSYTPQEIARMKQNFPMSAEDFQVANSYGIAGLPDLTEGQGVNDTRTQNQILGQTEQTTSTPNSLRNFQNPEFNEQVKNASEQALSSTDPSWLSKTWDATKQFAKETYGDTDWRDVVRMGVGVTSAGKGLYDDARTRQDLAGRIQNLNDRPRYMPNEYEFMGRPGSQSVIYAKHGAQIRTGTESGAEEAELERGEMFMLPNLDTYQVGGKKHSQGGEDFVLPEGTIVFSDYLKVPGVGKTFAEQAKKFDITKYKEILENPHAKSVDRSTAEVMMDRNMKKLQELFQIQQSMNGNSNGEVGQKVKGQLGLQYNNYNPNIFGPNASVVLTPEQQKQFYLNQGQFNNPDYQQESAALNNTEKEVVTQQAKKVLGLQQFAEAEADAEDARKSNAAITGAEPQPTLNTATNQNKQPLTDEVGTKAKTNAADSGSIYYRTLPNGRKVFVENQGEFAGKQLEDQYGKDPFNLIKNRLNEYSETLGPKLADSYNLEISSAAETLKKNKVNADKLKITNPDQLLDILERGEPFLRSMRAFYKSVGREQDLFDAKLDKGFDPNVQNQKAATLIKQYVESSQFAQDVASGKITTNIPQINEKIQQYTDANGQVRYRLPKSSVNLGYSAQYQGAYRALARVRNEEKKKGKDKDELRGVLIAPEGLSDQTFLGAPISEVSGREGNTELGQLIGFEGIETTPTTTPTEDNVKKTDEGKEYNKQLTNADTGKYEKEKFDYAQLAPEIYGMAGSQMFAYTIPDFNAPYLVPQTLNIQPQLQDIDNSYVAALNSGADPNSALIATLGAKQRIFSEKQNFDSQQRAQADQLNNQNRFQEDIYDMQSLDRVYNTLIASTDDAVTSQRQALVQSASQKRNVWKQEETKKQFWYNNFVRNFDYDSKTGTLKVKESAAQEFKDQIAAQASTYQGLPEVDNATKTTTTSSQKKVDENTGTTNTTTTTKTTSV